MLYISRRIADEATHKIIYGVVDTDDGIEEKVDYFEIQRAIVADGLEIAGATIASEDELLEIAPYPFESSASFIKSKMFRNIGVTAYKSSVVAIDWDREEILCDKVVRLSDFGTSIGDFILPWWSQDGSLKRKITLVLDDKITDISEYAFRLNMEEYSDTCLNGCEDWGLGVVVDVREMTNEDLLEVVYRQINTLEDICDAIVDHPDRNREFLRRVGVV